MARRVKDGAVSILQRSAMIKRAGAAEMVAISSALKKTAHFRSGGFGQIKFLHFLACASMMKPKHFDNKQYATE